eukprot:351012-Chlamydomonas_euryale.AAC.8
MPHAGADATGQCQHAYARRRGRAAVAHRVECFSWLPCNPAAASVAGRGTGRLSRVQATQQWANPAYRLLGRCSKIRFECQDTHSSGPWLYPAPAVTCTSRCIPLSRLGFSILRGAACTKKHPSTIVN